MAVKAGKIIAFLEEYAPPQLQADWDNSGLQVGNQVWPVDKVLLALDTTLEVVEYAARHGYKFILSHHPLLFHKPKNIDLSTPTGEIIALALANDIVIYSAHTNLDAVKGGVSDALVELLDLSQVEVLDRPRGDYYKLAVFVPKANLIPLRQALGDAGAGWIGQYSHCTFSALGQGTFLPREGANPWLGEVGKLETVEEYKLETLVSGHRLPKVLAAMKKVHPYEEIAYDLIPLALSADYGLGRIGLLPEPLVLDAFARRVASVLDSPLTRVCGKGDGIVRKVAVCGGSGGNYVSLAHKCGADVLVTGDVDHHQALTAFQLGLALVDPGHYFSEIPIMAKLEGLLAGQFPDLVIARYPGSTNPLRQILDS